MTALSKVLSGLGVACLVAVFSVGAAKITGQPALIVAIFAGMLVPVFWWPPCLDAGTSLASNQVLKLGIIFLGAGLSLADLQAMGPLPAIMAIWAVGICVLIAILVSKLIGRTVGYGLVTGGGVGICGAAAIAALGSALPRSNNEASDTEIALCMVSVTVLSAVCVLAYPPIAGFLQLSETETGIFFGATIHGVGQAIGVGHAQSPEVGNAATVTKLLRVSLLAPLVLAASYYRGNGWKGFAENLPYFILGFVACAMARNLGWLSDTIIRLASQASGICLLVAMSGLGLRTRFSEISVATLALPLKLTGYTFILMVTVLIILLIQRPLL